MSKDAALSNKPKEASPESDKEVCANGDSLAAPWSCGPLSVDTHVLARTFKLRQVFKLTDQLKASVGAAWNFNQRTLGPIGSLIFQIDDHTRAELTESRGLLYRRWSLGTEKLSVRLRAECSLGYRDLVGPGPPVRPGFHLSLEGVKPFKYELLGIGLVLLLNLPVSINNKEAEFKLPGLTRMNGYGKVSVKRTGPTHFNILPWDAALILDA